MDFPRRLARKELEQKDGGMRKLCLCKYHDEKKRNYAREEEMEHMTCSMYCRSSFDDEIQTQYVHI